MGEQAEPPAWPHPNPDHREAAQFYPLWRLWVSYTAVLLYIYFILFFKDLIFLSNLYSQQGA